MKTQPTDLDREAARLFVPAPGVRYLVDDEWCRVVQVHADGDWTACAGESDDLGPVAFRDSGPMFAMDASDDATVGVMLAQLQAKDPDSWCLEWPPDIAALVAAMRALKGKP